MPTPEQWLDTLDKRLRERWRTLQVYDAYYNGDQRLAFATAKWREAFGSTFAQVTDNWMRIVVDSSVERCVVQGFRFGNDQNGDEDAWDIWQANNLDAESGLVHTEAVKLGYAYWLVEPGDPPKITGEHPEQVIVAHAPGDRRERVAALKRWTDEDGYLRANVYLPQRVFKFRSQTKASGVYTPTYKLERSVPNPLGAVPVVPILNNPSMLRGGQSDLAGGVLRIQDGINKLLSDMLIGSEYQAYPQRVLLGVEPPVGPDGKPISGPKASQQRLWYFNAPDAKVAEFTAANLNAFVDASQHLVRHLTAQTRTPPHYVLGEIVNASGDALKAAETGLVSKVRGKLLHFGEGHEEAIRLAMVGAGKPRDERAETIWKDPETRSAAETVDAAVKLSTIGVPNEILWEKVGFSPQEIDRMRVQAQAEAFLNPPPPPPGTPNEQPGPDQQLP